MSSRRLYKNIKWLLSLCASVGAVLNATGLTHNATKCKSGDNPLPALGDDLLGVGKVVAQGLQLLEGLEGGLLRGDPHAPKTPEGGMAPHFTHSWPVWS